MFSFIKQFKFLTLFRESVRRGGNIQAGLRPAVKSLPRPHNVPGRRPVEFRNSAGTDYRAFDIH
jgi:hypothetical protein